MSNQLPRSAEFVIIGGGCTGASIAWNLTRLGARDVVLLDKSVLASGPTGRSSAQLIPRSENAVIARMKWEGLQFFSGFEAHTGRALNFQTTGYLAVAGPNQRAAFEADLAQLRTFAARAAIIRGADLKGVYSGLHADDEEIGLHLAEPGFTDPVAATWALAEAARASGARFFQFTPARAICSGNGRIDGIATEGGQIAAPRVIVACGVWTNQLLEPLGLDLPLFWHRAEVCSFRRPERLTRHPIIADFARRFYMRPEQEDLTLAGSIPDMAAGVRRPANLEPVASPDAFTEGATPATIRDIHEKPRARRPATAAAWPQAKPACANHRFSS